MTAELASDPGSSPEPAATSGARALVTSIRGSSLLLAGRAASMLVAFLTQVIIVRHLAKSDYGAFAYGLSAVLLVQSVLPLGMDRSDTRFLAMYDESGDRGRLLGVMALEAATIVTLGLAAIVAGLALKPAIQGSLTTSGAQGYDVLVALIALAPLQALDNQVMNVFAVFAKPWSVFARRYVMDPGLRLAVAVAMVLGDRGVVFLAIGFVVAAAAGLAIYLAMLANLLRRLQLLRRDSLRTLSVPFRQVMAFSVPLLVTNLVAVAGTELAAVVLGHYRPATDVAAFRAVQPLAALNLVVMFSFTTMFTPAAARACARGDRVQLRQLYWRSACWVAVLTFPILCVTTALAGPFTVAAFGQRYAGSASYLALLSIGYYVNAALGFNGVTVLMMGRVRYLTIGNVAVLAWMVVADLLLIPRWGAGGAVVAVVSTLLIHNVVKQLGLGVRDGVGIADAGHLRVLLHVAVGAGALAALAGAVAMPLAPGILVAVAMSLVVLRRVERHLDVGGTFPELARVRALRWLTAAGS